MEVVTRTLLVLTVAAFLASPLAAADKANKKKDARKKGKANKTRTVIVVRVPKSITLSEDQKAQVAVLEKEYRPQVTEARKKLNSILTPEQRKARQEAFKAARKSDKKDRKSIQAAVQAAVKLTDQQKQQYKDAQKAVATLNKEIRGKLIALLTDDQKAQLRPAKKTGAKKKPGSKSAKGKKKSAAKNADGKKKKAE